MHVSNALQISQPPPSSSSRAEFLSACTQTHVPPRQQPVAVAAAAADAECIRCLAF
jgi:hypothetical protein